MRPRLALLASLLLLGVCLAPATGGLATSAPGGAIVSVAVRAGDAAPGQGRFGARFACPQTFPGRVSARLTVTADGALLFVDDSGTAIFRARAAERETIAFAGEPAPGGARFASFCETSAGADGIAFHALLSDGRDGIFRIPPGGGDPEPVVLKGDTLALAGDAATVGAIAGPAIGAAGVVASLDFVEGIAAVVVFPAGAAPDIVMRSGDVLGSGFFQRSPTAPAENALGLIAFTATLASGRSAVAVRPPGAPPQAIFEDNQDPAPGQPFLTVDIAPPQINSFGQVAFLWSSGGTVRAQTGGPGPTFLAGPNMPVPGGAPLAEITDIGPAIDEAGNLLFGARRSGGPQGLYLLRVQGPTAAVEDGQVTGSGETLVAVGARDPDPRPAFGPSGSIWFAARSAEGGGLFSVTSGAVQALVHSGETVPEPLRFASFLETDIPVLGGGPSLARGGSMIFDARVTGGSRGLFVRDPDGALAAVAQDGDPAPGGGFWDGGSFAFHSLNSGGSVAFVGATAPSPGAPPSGGALYYGRRGPSGFSLARVIGEGDPVPDRAASVAFLQPPSRLTTAGEVAVPVVLSDGGSALYGFDGNALFRIAGTGDQAPAGGAFTDLFTGSHFLGTPIPPATGDDGGVLFGGTSSDFTSAIYLARMQPGGGGVPQRVVGVGDAAGGALLTPFEVQSLDRDASDRVALGAIVDGGPMFGTFLKDGPVLEAVALPFDFLGDLGFVLSVAPGLALTGNGGLAFGAYLFGGSGGGGPAILLRQGASAGAGGDPDALVLIAGAGGPSPDEGLYRAFQSGSRSTSRLSSDGQGRVAFAAATDAGPEEIVLFGAVANAPPAADAGPDQVVECAGPDGSAVRLDGTASSDPEGAALTYLWTGPFGQATGATPNVILPLGASVATLVVSDGRAESPPATVRIVVRDTLPPAINATAAPALLWPPDGKMREVSVTVSALDVCDPRPAVVLEDVTVQDAAPGGRPGPPVSGATIGTDDRSIELRADRSGSGPGRTYIVTYRAIDRSGNAAAATARVAVPHDLRH